MADVRGEEEEDNEAETEILRDRFRLSSISIIESEGSILPPINFGFFFFKEMSTTVWLLRKLRKFFENLESIEPKLLNSSRQKKIFADEF